MASFYARNGAGDLLARYSFIEPLLEGKRVLELGGARATAGGSALFLAERGAAAVLSLEPNEEDLGAAREAGHHPFVQFRSGAAKDLRQGTFDLVLVADGAALARAPETLAALRRLLAAGGRLVTAFPAGGAGLAEIAGEPPDEDVPPYEGVVSALSDHFALVEVATQSATVGWVLALAADGEDPEIAMDGTLAGTPEAAAYVAICGDEPCGLSGLQVTALPVNPLVEAAAEARGARQASVETEQLLEAMREERDEARGQLETRAEALYQAVAERDAATAARDAARADRELALQGRETARAERDDAISSREAERAREAEQARRELQASADAQARAQADLAERRAAALEAEAALRAARAESQAAKSAVEEALELREREEDEERADAAELRAGAAEREAERERERGELAQARADAERLGRELEEAREAVRGRADEARAEVEQVRATLAARDEADREAATAREGLEAQVAELTARLESEEERLRLAAAEAAEARAQRESVEEAVGDRIRGEEEERTRAETARADAAEERARTLEAEGREGAERAVRELDEARAELGVLRAKLMEHDRTATAGDEVGRLRNAAEAAEAQAAEIEAELQAVRWEKDEIEQRLQSAQATAAVGSSGDVARLLEEVATRVGEIALLRKELSQREAVVAELTARPEAAPDPAAETATARAQVLEEQVAQALKRAADAEAALEAARPAAGAPPLADAGEALIRAAQEKEALVTQISERDQRIARLQREVTDKTDRLGRLAREMGELKAKGIGKIFR